jgi:hypothetical protein
MSNAKFLDDLEEGKYGEYLFQRYLQKKGLDVKSAPEEEFPYYDIVSILYGKKHTYEVKTDRQIHKTGNLYIEFLNINRMALSGIFTSTADFYVYIDRESLMAYVFNRGYLLRFVFEGRYTTLKSKVDNENAMGWIVPIKEVLDKRPHLKTIDLNGIE